MNEPRIPIWSQRFFKWYCDNSLYEELQGDLEEAYHENCLRLSVRRANHIYRMEVLKLLRPSVIRFGQNHSKFNHLVMLNNYFKTSLRSMMRSPLSSFINIFGLSVAVGICLIVYAFIDQDLSIDQFHENKHEVFLITSISDQDGELLQYGQTPLPLGPMLAEDFSQITKISRIDDANVVIKYEDKVFHETVRAVNAAFLEMLTFPMQWGSAATLEDPNSILLSDDMSVKYFGDLNPVGKHLLLNYGDGRTKSFIVAGVTAPFPKAHAIGFDFLINDENLKMIKPALTTGDWSHMVHATLIQVKDAAQIDYISTQMNKYKTFQRESNPDRVIHSFNFVSLANLHFASNDIINGISYGTRKEGWIILTIMALFILILACFNYINIAIVSAAKRLKEIGVRKVIGANRRLVIFQFLAENILVTFFALLIGLVLGHTMFIPWFNNLFGRGLELELFDFDLWSFLFAILFVTGFASGIYPAFYISKFQVVGIFKGSIRLGKKNPLTKLFLTFQLILAFIAISGGVWFTQNNVYQKQRSWGYQPENVLYVDVPDRSSYEQIYAAMDQNADVVSIAGAQQHLGHKPEVKTIMLPDRSYEVGAMAIGDQYIETMGLKLLSGRSFETHHASDKNKIVVNEQLVKKLSFTQPLGQIVKLDSTNLEIIGVIRDSHVRDFDHKIQPIIYQLSDKKEYRYLAMKVSPGKQSDVYQFLREEWISHFPNTPFKGGYQEGVFNGYFDYLDSSAEFMRALASIAILLASLGLYGLITLNISGRIREFSIRKVLGASLTQVTTIIAKQYIWLLLFSMAIGGPAGYLLIETLFETVFAYHMPMNYSGMLISALVLIGVLLVTIHVQVRKFSQANPAEGLRVE